MSSSRRSDLVIRVRYANPLPPPPFPPKLLNIATDPKRYARVEFTSALSNETPLPMVVDAEAGMPLDLSLYECLWNGTQDDNAINPSFSDVPADPRDAFLLEGYDNPSAASSRPGVNVSWLRKTEYLSRDSSSKSYITPTEIKSVIEAPIDVSRSAQIRDIEAIFPSQSSIDKHNDLTLLIHPTKPGLTAVASYEVLPDPDLWANSYDIFRFSERPGERPLDQQDPRLDCAILRPMESDGDHFLAYYLTKEDQEALSFKQKRQTTEEGLASLSLHDDEDDPTLTDDDKDHAKSVAFHWVRDYETARIEQDVEKEFLLVFDEKDDLDPLLDGDMDKHRSTSREVRGAYYTPIQRKITLKKRRANRNEAYTDKWDVIALNHVPLSEEETHENKEALAEIIDPGWLSRITEEGDGDADGDADHGAMDADGEADGEAGMDVDHIVTGSQD